MIAKDRYSILMKLRTINHQEFRHQLSAQLKRIASEKNLEQLALLLDQFKKDFITDFSFYIDDINEILRNLLLGAKDNFSQFYRPFIFLAQIGDSYTLDLLKKTLSYINEPHAKSELEKVIQELENKLHLLEERFYEFKLFPIVDVMDQWAE